MMSVLSRCRTLLAGIIRNQKSQRRTRLGLELLEERWVPADFRWRPSFGTNNLWSWPQGSNWEVRELGTGWDRAEAGNFPGAANRTDDTALFDHEPAGGDLWSYDCVMNTPVTVKKLETSQLYRSTVRLEHTLTIATGGVLVMGGWNPTIAGSPALKQIKLEGSMSRFNWHGGSLVGVQVVVGSGARMELPIPVQAHGESENPYLAMTQTHIDVESGGMLAWQSRSVVTHFGGDGLSFNLIHVHKGGFFTITAKDRNWGHDSADKLVIENEGYMTVRSDGQARLNGKLYNKVGGSINVERGTLDVGGSAIQQGATASINIRQNATFHPSNAAGTLDIERGTLTGGGRVDGSVVMYGGDFRPRKDTNFIGTFTITGIFDMRGGTLFIDVGGPSDNDSVTVTGQALLGGTVQADYFDLTHDGSFLPFDRIRFLRYGGATNDFAAKNPPSTMWVPRKGVSQYWFQQAGVMTGRVGNDLDGDGVFEPDLGETVLAGVPVDLLDEYDTVVATTTTAADGTYQFDELGFGVWKAGFYRPPALRPVQPGAGTDPALNSDYDYATLVATVTLDEYFPTSITRTDALFRPLTAVDDEYHVLDGHTLTGNVLDNDPPAAGDTLTVTLYSAPPLLGTLTLNADGSFVYLAPEYAEPGPTVAVEFVYMVTDSYGHVAFATVVIYVHPQWTTGNGDPPPPPP